MTMRTLAMSVAALLVAASSTACGSAGTGDVGYLGAASGSSVLQNATAGTTLGSDMNGARLLVLMAVSDGPDNPAIQRTQVSDTRNHVWTLQAHHIVFGSIIDVYTAPTDGNDVGTVVSSDVTVKRGDEGHGLTVAAYSNARLDGITRRNGTAGIPQLRQTVPAGQDTWTIFGDGRKNDPITLVPGFRPVTVIPVDGGRLGDKDLYQASHLEPPGSWEGGEMLTGNLGPEASNYWGLVNVNLAPLP